MHEQRLEHLELAGATAANVIAVVVPFVIELFVAGPAADIELPDQRNEVTCRGRWPARWTSPGAFRACLGDVRLGR